MAKSRGVDPLLLEGEVEHGEGGVARHIRAKVEEAGHVLTQGVTLQGGVGLQ